MFKTTFATSVLLVPYTTDAVRLERDCPSMGLPEEIALLAQVEDMTDYEQYLQDVIEQTYDLHKGKLREVNANISTFSHNGL